MDFFILRYIIVAARLFFSIGQTKRFRILAYGSRLIHESRMAIAIGGEFVFGHFVGSMLSYSKESIY